MFSAQVCIKKDEYYGVVLLPISVLSYYRPKSTINNSLIRNIIMCVTLRSYFFYEEYPVFHAGVKQMSEQSESFLYIYSYI